MNICVVTTFDGTTEDYMELWNKFEEKRKNFVTDYDIGVVREGKIICHLNVADMDGLMEVMSDPIVEEWDKKFNSVDVIYSLEKQG